VIAKLRPTLDGFLAPRSKKSKPTLFSPSWLPFSSTVNHINEINPDIVHLHWIAGGMMRIEDLAKIKVPIVWSLHDMWAFTDGYHYDAAFDYVNNVFLDESKTFIQKIVFLRKSKTYQKLNRLTIIGISKWLNTCSKYSKLLRDKPHFNLPNPIDTSTFAPFDKNQARSLLNLKADKKLILFGAVW
jgi:hypothetical protein